MLKQGKCQPGLLEANRQTRKELGSVDDHDSMLLKDFPFSRLGMLRENTLNKFSVIRKFVSRLLKISGEATIQKS